MNTPESYGRQRIIHDNKTLGDIFEEWRSLHSLEPTTNFIGWCWDTLDMDVLDIMTEVEAEDLFESLGDDDNARMSILGGLGAWP